MINLLDVAMMLGFGFVGFGLFGWVGLGAGLILWAVLVQGGLL